MGKDKRGVDRGGCAQCDCKEYEVFDKRLLCDYCGHRPIDHEVKQTGRPRRVCTPKRPYSPTPTEKVVEKRANLTPVVKVEPLLTAGGKKILSADPLPARRRSTRTNPKVRVKTEPTEAIAEQKDPQENNDDKADKPQTPSRKRKVVKPGFFDNTEGNINRNENLARKGKLSENVTRKDKKAENVPENKNSSSADNSPEDENKVADSTSGTRRRVTRAKAADQAVEDGSKNAGFSGNKQTASKSRAENRVTVVMDSSDNVWNEAVVEMELDSENHPETADQQQQVEEDLEQEIVLSEESEQKVELVETLHDSITAPRPKRAKAGNILSKLVERERGSDDDSLEEQSEEQSDDKRLPHKCAKCGRRFKLLSNLLKHKKEHNQRKYKQRRFLCGLCSARFITRYDLRRHIDSHRTTEEILSCEDCGKDFKDEDSLAKHKKSHTTDCLFACNICYKTFTRRYDLKRHNSSVHEDYHYTCGVCGLAYKSQKTLTNHEAVHLQRDGDDAHFEDTSVLVENEDEDFIDDDKDEDYEPEEDATIVAASKDEFIAYSWSSPQRDKRKSHLTRGEKVFQCMLCVKAFTTKDQLRQHILEHAGKYPNTCDFCGQGFFVPRQLKDHISSAHGDTSEREFQCSECCCCFQTEEELLKHGEWHGEKDNKITISNKKLVEIVKKIDSISSAQFLADRSIWLELNGETEHTDETDTGEEGAEIEGYYADAVQTEVRNEEGEIKIQIELDNSQEDLDDNVANKLLFGNPKAEKVSKPFTCKVCLKAFAEKMYCRCHVLAHVGVYRHKCENCGLGFLKNSDLKRHGVRCKRKSRKSRAVTMRCGDCELLFDNEIDFMQHRNEVCSKNWEEGGLLNAAALGLEDKATILESLKEEARTTPENFIITHEGITNSGKPIRTCTEVDCGLVFANRPQLKHHLKQVHGIILGPVPRKGDNRQIKTDPDGNNKEGLVCNICGSRFKTSLKLFDHKSTMHGEKSYSCSVCGKAFGRKFDCQRHEENVHYGSNSCHCDICGKVCKDKYTVQIHKRVVHDQIKEHICPHCGHKFSQKSNLNNHMRTHTHEKPYQCSECFKWFSTRQYRDMHMRIHTGERPHKCSYCSRTFSHPASLKYHIRTHEDGRPYPCFSCPRKFRDPSKRTKHAKICPGEQGMIIARTLQGQAMLQGQGQSLITGEEDGHQVTLQLDQSVIDSLMLEPETTQIQIEHDETIEEEHVHQIEQLIQDNQIQLEEEGTQVLVLDQGGGGEGVYLLVPTDTVSVEGS